MIERIKCFMPGLAQAWAPRHKMLSRVVSLFLCILVLFSCIPFEVSAASSTDYYWYNGVELPPLPSDVSTSSFLILYRFSNSTYYLFPNNGFYYKDGYLYTIDGVAVNYYSPRTTGLWGKLNNTWSSIDLSAWSITWSSSDILYQNSDEVYYSANRYALPYSQKDIYSYNDLIAPSVFNLNSISYLTKYYIWQDKSTHDYYAYTFWSSTGWEEDNNRYRHGDLVDYYYSSVRYRLVDGVWSESYSFTGAYNIDFSQYEIVWSSVDLTDLSYNVKYEGSDAVPLGNLTSLYTVLPEDDKWEVKQGGTKRFEIASGQNLPIETVTWQLKGNIVSGTSIDYNGLLTVSSNQPLGTIYVVASNINGEGYSSEAAVTVLPEQTPNTDYVIRPQSTGTYYVGNSYNFSCVNSSGVSASSVVWSVYSDYVPIASGTYIDSSGTLHLSSSQNPGNLTLQASSINGTDTYTFYNISVFANMSGGDGGGGDNPAPSPTPGNQDIIDSLDEGFTGLGNKILDLGDNIITGITEAIFRLFIPTSEELTAQMNSFVDWVNTSFPILGIPMEFVSYTYDLFIGVTPELALMNFPQIKVMDHVIIEETSLDLKQYEWLDTILPIIRTLLTMAACYAFGSWAIRRVKEIGNI